MTQKDTVRDVLHANKAHQQALKTYAERLEAELKVADRLIAAVEAQDRESDDDNGQGLVRVDGAVKPTSIVLPSALLSEDSPFYEDVLWKKRYDDYVSSVPMKAKEHDALTDAIRIENQRIFALAAQSRGEQPFAALRSYPLTYFEQNKEGIDWTRISKKVSESIPSGAPRSAKECEIRWLGYLHPEINKDSWTPEETERLRAILLEKGGQDIDWVDVSKQLGGNRVPLDCMRQGLSRRTHQWTPETDKKLLEAVDVYGQHNWQLVAKAVSEDATAQQCQKRYNDTLDPNLRRGAWTEDEDSRLSRAVAAYTDTPMDQLRTTFAAVKLADRGIPWQDVALFVPGRNNNQCRERFQILMNPNEKSQKGTWSEEEDGKLLIVVDELGGPGKWKEVAESLGSGRNDVQCRKRYEVLKKRRDSTIHPPVTPPLQIIMDAETGDTVPVGSKPAKKKGKAKATVSDVQGGATQDARSAASASTQPTKEIPKPRPRGRPRKNPAAQEIQQDSSGSRAPDDGGTDTAGPSNIEHDRPEPSDVLPESIALHVDQLLDPSCSSTDNVNVEEAGIKQSSRKRKRGEGQKTTGDAASPTKKKTRRKADGKEGSDTVGSTSLSEVGKESQVRESEERSKRGRGGKRTGKAETTAESGRQDASTSIQTTPSEPVKKKRGRPRKKPVTVGTVSVIVDEAPASPSQGDGLNVMNEGRIATVPTGDAEPESNDNSLSHQGREQHDVETDGRRRSKRISKPK